MADIAFIKCVKYASSPNQYRFELVKSKLKRLTGKEAFKRCAVDDGLDLMASEVVIIFQFTKVPIGSFVNCFVLPVNHYFLSN